MIQNILVLGAGSAGLLAALTVRRLFPRLPVRIVRSKDIGVIGVGEGTTPAFPEFLFRRLNLRMDAFYSAAQPTWKLGTRFFWGRRPEFVYTFSQQFNFRWPDLLKNNGFYCDGSVDDVDVWAALMHHGKAFPRKKDGTPDFVGHQFVAFHIENHRLVEYLERQAAEIGITFTEGTVQEVEVQGESVRSLLLDNGERLTADLFIDASGFRSELLGKALGEPFRSFSDSLFCDRAVIGGWARTDEPIKPYTTSETMDAGWAWQIEHERFINRGYVYSSAFLSDDEARAEFLRKNPKVDPEKTRVVKFRTGRYERAWVGNVVGIGNASGFVEPLEATALTAITVQCRALADCLFDSTLEPPPSMVSLYNRLITEAWDEVRDFIALHYYCNHRLDTPFWRMAVHETKLATAQPIVDFYTENGPSGIHQAILLRQSSTFGIEGYLAMLVGQKMPHNKPYQPSAVEWERWNQHRARNAGIAQAGFSVRETLDLVRRADVKWE